METRPIGMIGGLGPAATAHYYLGMTTVFAGRSVTPRLIINQADMALVLDAAAKGDIDALADHIAERMEELQRAGAELLAIASVTAHLCMPKLSKRVLAPIIDIIDVTLLELDRRGVKRVALMGTRAAVSSRLFGRLASVAVDPPSDQIDRVHELYLTVVRGDARMRRSWPNSGNAPPPTAMNSASTRSCWPAPSSPWRRRKPGRG